jgi:dienelactone hydrolase
MLQSEEVAMSTITSEWTKGGVGIPIGGRMRLSAEVTAPLDARGVVLFVHGSGSSRYSPRNRYVAYDLNSRRIATVLVDLLTDEEQQLDAGMLQLRFDVPLLTRRVVELIDWVETSELVAALPIGLYGASTGAAAALDAAAERPSMVDAVVSRGGRCDLANQLRSVRAPTLLIVGGNDTDVLRANGEALRQLTCTKELEVIPGATHLFEQPGALEAVASATGAWFQRFLVTD